MKGFDHDGLLRHLRSADGVVDVHHLHVWEISEGRTAIEVHLATDRNDLAAATSLKEALKKSLHDQFEIEHATIEMELAGMVEHDRDIVPKAEG